FAQAATGSNLERNQHMQVVHTTHWIDQLGKECRRIDHWHRCTFLDYMAHTVPLRLMTDLYPGSREYIVEIQCHWRSCLANIIDRQIGHQLKWQSQSDSPDKPIN